MSDNAASKRPSDSKFKQQKLPAWKPVLTPSSVLPTFFGIGALFIIIGSILLAQTDDVVEKEWEYTDCLRTTHLNTPDVYTGTCGDLLENNANFTDTDALHNRCECILEVKLEGFEDQETFIYYAFENYYQNHRRYVKSRSDAQLRSAQVMGNDECDPLESKDGKYYAPCGLIANSLFNDTIELLTDLGSQTYRDSNDPNATTVTVPGALVNGYTGSDISWNSDRDVKFKNPCEGDGCDLCGPDGLNGTDSLKPPNWPVDACKLGEKVANCETQCNSESGPNSNCAYNPHSSCFESSGLGYQNEDFIVWMRTAALPTFRKLYRRVPKGFKDGDYFIRIGYNYPVKNFKGIKKIFISTTSSLGGKSWFLPSMYLVVGILSFVAGAGFLVMQHFFGLSRKLGDVSNLAWHGHNQ